MLARLLAYICFKSTQQRFGQALPEICHTQTGLDGGNLATPQPQKSPKTPQNVTQATFKYVFRSVRDLPHTFFVYPQVAPDAINQL